jgi:archaeosine-15-forming tRNA-guanine transglycosylase
VFKYGEQYLCSKALDLKYGDGKAEELHNRRHETHKFSTGELEQIIHDSKEQIAWYESQS